MSPSRSFEAVLRGRISRRDFLGATALIGTAAAIGPVGCANRAPSRASSDPTFVPIRPDDGDVPRVADGYDVHTVIRWGDPLFEDSPPFDPATSTGESQARQFGYNNDLVTFFPLDDPGAPSRRGLLVVNHETTDDALMHPDFPRVRGTRRQLEVSMAAHGISVVEIVRDTGGWHPVVPSRYNRRLTAASPMHLTGPAAGHAWLRTAADPDGRTVLGTLNNCAGGRTPWGTVISAEENIQDYFGEGTGQDPDDPRTPVHTRYAIDRRRSHYGWERIDPRFSVASERNEAFRFGWLVEFDPYDPDDVPRKRTAMGRFRHEAAIVVTDPRGRAVVYAGDDQAFECIYRFVSRDRVAEDRAGNRELLDHGTLHVARFDEDGTGRWLPLVHGEGPLTAANGFASQSHVLIDTRGAAAALGGTRMDRPEDIAVNPITGKVYVALTNNGYRGRDGHPATDAVNPRAGNKYGHILEIIPDGGDHAADTFRWEIFMLCGDPSDEDTYYAGFPRGGVSPIAAPDNLVFDRHGTLWIATDGQPSRLGTNDGLHAVPTEGPCRGCVQQFFSGVTGAEVTSPDFTPDERSLFVAIQHPGGGTFENPTCRWPDGVGPPRPSVVVIEHAGGGPVGRG